MSCNLPGVPEGYEPVRFGFPKKGELFFNGLGSIIVSTEDWDTGQRLIVRKTWTPPEWLKPGWIFKDGNGFWNWSDVKPSWVNGRWLPNGLAFMFTTAVKFEAPCVNPEDSLIQIGGE